MGRIEWPCFALALISVASLSAQTVDHEIEKGLVKAIAYLERETPKWRTEHHCASCHHQGSAARALLSARRFGKLKSESALDNSLDWLSRPRKWAENHGDPMASDQTLAEIQFGWTLLQANPQYGDRLSGALPELAKVLAVRQDKSGRMELEASEGLATPITLGPILLTGVAQRVFATQGETYRENEKRADQWLREYRPRNTLEASSLLLALGLKESNNEPRKRARKLLLESAHEEGGFGPYAAAPAEAFDTALAILALSRDEDAIPNEAIILKAKRKLLRWQREEGSFEETTRPSGGVSYAHRVSTTAWAVEALLESTGRELTEPSLPPAPK